MIQTIISAEMAVGGASQPGYVLAPDVVLVLVRDGAGQLLDMGRTFSPSPPRRPRCSKSAPVDPAGRGVPPRRPLPDRGAAGPGRPRRFLEALETKGACPPLRSHPAVGQGQATPGVLVPRLGPALHPRLARVGEGKGKSPSGDRLPVASALWPAPRSRAGNSTTGTADPGEAAGTENGGPPRRRGRPGRSGLPLPQHRVQGTRLVLLVAPPRRGSRPGSCSASISTRLRVIAGASWTARCSRIMRTGANASPPC